MRPEVNPNYHYQVANTPELLEQARRLHGKVYLRRGYVAELVDGKVEDPFVPFSRYFVGVNQLTNTVGVTIRQIGYGRFARSHLKFPALSEFNLYPDWQRHMPDFDAKHPVGVVELSALAADRTAMVDMFALAPGLYRYMWQSQEKSRWRQRYWLGSIDERLFRVFVGYFHFNFVQIGEPKYYQGSPTIPAVLDLDKEPQYMFDHDRELYQFFLEGLPLERHPVVVDPLAATALETVTAA